MSLQKDLLQPSIAGTRELSTDLPAQVVDSETDDSGLIDIVRSVFFALDRPRDTKNPSPSFVAAQAAFDVALSAFKAGNIDLDPTAVASHLINERQIPGEVTLWDESRRHLDGIDFVRQLRMVWNLNQFGIIKSSDFVWSMSSAGNPDRSNGSLLDHLNELGAIASTERIESQDPNSPVVIDHVLPTPFEGVVAHLGIEEGKLDIRGNEDLDLAHFRVSIAPEVYGQRFVEKTLPKPATQDTSSIIGYTE